VGPLLGAFIGSIKVTFPIKGKQDNYERYRDKIKKRSIKFKDSVKDEKTVWNP